MEPCRISYRRLVFLPRALRGVTISLSSIPCLAFGYFILANIRLNPVYFLQDVIGVCFSFTWPLYSTLLGLAYFTSYGHQATTYDVVYEKLVTNVDVVRFIFSRKVMATVIVQASTSLVVISILTSACGGRYEDLIIYCNQDDVNYSGLCMNELKLFMLLFGALVSIVSTVQFFVYGRNVLQFSQVTQPTYFYVKSELQRISLESLRFVFSLFIYYILAYFIGGVLEAAFAIFFPADDQHDMGLRCWYSLFDIALLYQTFLCGFVIKINLEVTHLIFWSKLIQPVEYDVGNEKAENSIIKSMSISKEGLCKMSALQDLAFLSTSTAADCRRQHVYSLSQPGGHPYVWKSISSQLYTGLSNLLIHLTELSRDSGVSARKLNRGAIETVSTSDRYTPKGKGKAEPPKSTLDLLKSSFVLPSLSSKLSDHVCATQFSDVQKHIWAVQALSGLISHSLTEDKYGIVQQDLSKLITLLLELYQVVERISITVPSLTRRAQPNDVNRSSHQLVIEFRSTLKTSLYRVSVAFGKHIDSVENLSEDHKKRIQLFASFKE